MNSRSGLDSLRRTSSPRWMRRSSRASARVSGRSTGAAFGVSTSGTSQTSSWCRLPLYSPDHDTDYPPEATALKEAIARSDAVLFVTPEYNRSIPGALKNAIDWASRPWGQNSFHHIPAGVIGASIGAIGAALAQQSLRGVLSFCNARQMTSPEAYIRFSPEVFHQDGEVVDESTAAVLRDYMLEFRDHVVRVLTVLPRP